MCTIRAVQFLKDLTMMAVHQFTLIVPLDITRHKKNYVKPNLYCIIFNRIGITENYYIVDSIYFLISVLRAAIATQKRF